MSHYSIAETARRLGISIDSVYRLVRGGKLPATKQDGHWQIAKAAVSERIRARKL